MEYLVLDTETGGTDPFKHSLLQIGLVAYVGGTVVDRLELNIKEDSYIIDAEALEYNGLDLYNDIYYKGYTKDVVVKRIKEFIGSNFKGKPILLGHNVSMDKYFLKVLFDKEGVDMDEYVSYRMVDTMTLLWVLYEGGKISKSATSSSGAFEYFNIEVEKRHTALSDADATLELFKKIRGII